ncbi:MAG TPA: TolC family protein [Deltaproteobacteria bacterium]|nr:TolC family protein [Deltaproteobacteria bacterium]
MPRFPMPALALAALLVLAAVSHGFAGEDSPVYTLDEIIEVAMRENPSVAVFRANLDAARGEVTASRAYPNPEVEVGGSRGTSLETDESAAEFSISIGQPIEWPGKRLYREKAARSALERREIEKESFLIELRYEVKAAFYRLLLANKEVEIAAENLTTVEKLLATVRARVEAGETPEFELVKARVEKLKAGKALRSAEKKALIAAARLNGLLGNALPAGFAVKGEFRSPVGGYSKEEILARAFEDHPFIRAAKKQVELSRNELRREQESVMPDVTVRGFYDKEIDKKTVGLGISVPLPVWYRNSGEIASASAALAQAQADLHRTRVELSVALDEALRDYEIALGQTEVFEEGLLEQARQALRIAEFSYAQGASGILDYLDAQRVYRETLLDYGRARFDLSLAIIDIERLSGEEE